MRGPIQPKKLSEDFDPRHKKAVHRKEERKARYSTGKEYSGKKEGSILVESVSKQEISTHINPAGGAHKAVGGGFGDMGMGMGRGRGKYKYGAPGYGGGMYVPPAQILPLGVYIPPPQYIGEFPVSNRLGMLPPSYYPGNMVMNPHEEYYEGAPSINQVIMHNGPINQVSSYTQNTHPPNFQTPDDNISRNAVSKRLRQGQSESAVVNLDRKHLQEIAMRGLERNINNINNINNVSSVNKTNKKKEESREGAMVLYKPPGELSQRRSSNSGFSQSTYIVNPPGRYEIGYPHIIQPAEESMVGKFYSPTTVPSRGGENENMGIHQDKETALTGVTGVTGVRGPFHPGNIAKGSSSCPPQQNKTYYIPYSGKVTHAYTRLGGLGANMSEEWKRKYDLATKAKDFARGVGGLNKRNSLRRSTNSTLPISLQSDNLSKRQRGLDFARRIPKPRLTNRYKDQFYEIHEEPDEYKIRPTQMDILQRDHDALQVHIDLMKSKYAVQSEY